MIWESACLCFSVVFIHSSRVWGEDDRVRGQLLESDPLPESPSAVSVYSFVCLPDNSNSNEQPSVNKTIKNVFDL